MANTLHIALQNAVNATKLLDRALDALEECYNKDAFDYGNRTAISKIRSNNSHNLYLLERMQR